MEPPKQQNANQMPNVHMSVVKYKPLILGPSLAHVNSLLPSRELLVLLRSIDLRSESSDASSVDILKLVEGFPDTDCKTGGDGGAECGGFEHLGAFDWDADEICLCL